MAIGLLNPTGYQKFKFRKSKMADNSNLENKKPQHLHNCLAAFDKILHGDEIWQSGP